MTKEKILLQARISQYEKTLALINGAKAIVQQFDGKCYNKRFDEAFVSAGCYFAHARFDKNRISIKRLDGHVDDYACILAMCHLSDFLDDKRINSEKLNALIDEYTAHTKQEVERLTVQAEHVESTIALLNEKIANLNNMIKDIDNEILDIYKYKISRITSQIPR